MIRFGILLGAIFLSGCSIKSRECGVLFDKLQGRGPVMIDPLNSSAAAAQFFQQASQTSSIVSDIVANRGAPDAISVEREFLQPNRLKLFYPTADEVFVLDDSNGEWFVAGSEPLAARDRELLEKQHQTRVQPVIGQQGSPLPVVNPVDSKQLPVARVHPAEFRGRLDPSSSVAELEFIDVP